MQSELEETLEKYKDNQKRAKHMIVIWFVAIAVITGFFLYGANEYSKTQEEIENLRADFNAINEQASADRLRIQTVLNELKQIKNSVENLTSKQGDAQKALYVANKYLQKSPLVKDENDILLAAYTLKSEDDESAPEIILLKGIKSFDNNEYEQALSYFEQSKQNSVTEHLSYWAIGRVYFSQRQFEQALEQFTLALNAQESSTQYGALVDRGLTYVRLHSDDSERLSEALNDYDKSIAMGNEYPVVFRRRGLVRLRIGQIDGAIKDFDQAVNFSATEEELASAIENQALASLSEEKWLLAIERSKTVLKVYPSSSWNWAIRTIAFKKLGEEKNQACSLQRWVAEGGDTASSIRYYMPSELWQELGTLYESRDAAKKLAC